ncbi:MAG: ABC transporter permease subunit [Clostridiales bacterium]|nr:ABC transporter permease subunit [Clostridiales bacterium]
MRTNASKWLKTLYAQRQLVVLSLPVLFLLVFNYYPLWGWLIAFQDYKIGKNLTLFQQKWVGLDNFISIFTDSRFYSALVNTMGMGLLKIIFSYLFTLTLAVLINEIRLLRFKKAVQTISYLPHFVSWVVAANLLFVVFSPDNGIINLILMRLGIIDQTIPFMGMPSIFWLVVAFSEVWKSSGYGAIIYLSAMTAIDPVLYESADIDGAGRVRKIFSVTLPSIMPTVKILLVLTIGRLLSVGFEQVYLLRTAMTMSTGTTLEIYIYEFALRYAQYSKGAALSIFNSAISLALIFISHMTLKYFDQEGVF